MVAAVSASKMACMSSARPTTPRIDTDFPERTTSSIPGRVVAARRCPVTGSLAPPRPEYRLVGLVVDGALQPEADRSPAAPHQRGLPPGPVIGQRLAGMVIAPGQ